MGTREVEIKGRLDKPSLVLFHDWVKSNASHIGKEHHREVYLDRVDDSFFSTSVDGERDAVDFLRIRESQSVSVCLKRWHRDPSGDLTFCDEYNLDVSSFSHALDLFVSLGYTPKVDIYKTRTTYRMTDFEIVFDYVEHLGDFFEVEWIGISNIDPAMALERIRAFLINAGVRSYFRLRRGYVSMVLNPSISYEIFESLG